MRARGQRHAPAVLYPAARFMVHNKNKWLFSVSQHGQACEFVRPSVPCEVLMLCVEQQMVQCRRNCGGRSHCNRAKFCWRSRQYDDSVIILKKQLTIWQHSAGRITHNTCRCFWQSVASRMWGGLLMYSVLTRGCEGTHHV